MSTVHVMAAVVCNPAGDILIAKRPDDKHQGGLWEFPGGKLEDGEARFAGLRRELQEELGIVVTEARPLIDIHYHYPDKSVRLDVWKVTAFEGEAHGAEGQPVRWVNPSQLNEYAFPAANAPIVTAAQLPDLYLITPDLDDDDAILAGLGRAVDQGISLAQLRQTQVEESAYAALAESAMQKFGGSLQLMLKSSRLPRRPNAGWHLTASQLRKQAEAGWQKGTEVEGWLAASCHDKEELALAEKVGADFVTLSPLLPTQSHPGSATLGWDRAKALIATTNLPVYLLGGVGPEHLDQAFEAGAQGIAGISRLWPPAD